MPFAEAGLALTSRMRSRYIPDHLSEAVWAPEMF